MKQASACLALFCAAALTLQAGCTTLAFVGGAAAGAGGAVWYYGALRTTLPGSVPRVREAAAVVLQKMGDGIVAEKGDSLGADLRSRALDGKSIRIHLKSLSPQVTEISIRVGFFGDRGRSQVVLNEIVHRLDSSAAQTRSLGAARKQMAES